MPFYFPQIFFNLTTLFSYPVFFSLFHAPLNVVVHFFVFHRSFRFKPFLSQFAPFVTQIMNFCSDPEFFLLMMFAKDLTGCFSHCCVESGDHWIYVCIFVARDGERCKPPAYHSLEGFQHIGIFQLFWGQTWVLRVLACWFFSGKGGRSSSASRDHFQCLLLENFVFWQCSLLIGSASSLECNQSGCGVVHLGLARSIFWMLCLDHMCSPAQDC